MSSLTFLFILYICNLILDFPLQGEFLSKYKQQNNYILFVHCMIWAGGLSLVLMYLGIFLWWKFAVLFIGHIVIDYWKCRSCYKKYKTEDWQSLYIDQFLHFIQLCLCLI